MWFYPLYIHAFERKDNILPSKLKIAFLSDTGASISVLNLPTFHVIAKQLNLNVPKDIENKRAKSLTVANQTEVPIVHYVSTTCFTEVNNQNRSFNIEFAAANIKYNILGAPFFKKIIQNIDFQQNINFEYSDLTDTEYVNFCNFLMNNQHCYAKHGNDVGKISTPFRIRIKENCKLQTKRLSKVPIHFRDRLNKLLTELEKYNIIKQIASSSDEKHTIGTTIVNL